MTQLLNTSLSKVTTYLLHKKGEPPSSSSRLCRQKDHRRSRSTSPCPKEPLEASPSAQWSLKSQNLSSVEACVPKHPYSSKSVEQKYEPSMAHQRNGSQSRSPHARYHHKRPLDTAPTKQQPKRRKIFAPQSPGKLSSLSRLDKQKHKLDDKFNYYRSLSRSPAVETATIDHFIQIIIQAGPSAVKKNLLCKEIMQYHLFQDRARKYLDQLKHIKERGPYQGFHILETATRNQ